MLSIPQIPKYYYEKPAEYFVGILLAEMERI